MNSTKYTIIVFLYVVTGIAGFLRYAFVEYLDEHSWNNVLVQNIIPLICSAIVAGYLFFLLYKKGMRQQYEERKNKFWFIIAMPFFSFLITFCLNFGWLFHTEIFFADQGKLFVKGIVDDTSMKRNRKGRKSFYIHVSDTSSKSDYFFRVRKKVYARINKGTVIQKEFTISKLGVIYRNGE